MQPHYMLSIPFASPQPRLSKPSKANRINNLQAGAVAQLGERCVRNAEVGSSTLLRSTLRRKDLRRRVNDGPAHDTLNIP